LAAGGYLSNKAMNFVENRYGNTAATTGAGAAAGATTGAAVGTFFAGPTGGLSIAVGAAIGAIVGGITGWIKSGEAKKKAREAGRNFAGDYADAIEEILSTNNIDDAKTALVAFDAELASFAEGQSRSKELTKEAQKVFEEERKSLEATITVMDNRIEDLGKVSNLTKNQIIELANAMEVHLGNSAIQLWEIMSVTGIAVRRFGEDFQHYITDTFASDVEQILGDVAILNAPVVKNEIAQGFVDALKAGDAGTPEFGEFLQGIQDQNLMQFGAMGADRAMVSMLGETFGAPGAAAFMPGGFFGARGVTPADFTDEQRTIYNQYMGRRKESYAGAAAENIFSMLAQRGKLPAGMTVERLTNLLVKNNSIQDIMNLSQRTGQGDLFFEAEGRRGIVYNNLETQLTGLFDEFNIDLGQNIKLEETNDQKMLQGIKDFVTGTGDFKGAANDVFAIAVDKFDLAVDRLPGDDTATPRSNIVNTLGAHGRFDAMIAGKRSVMSGLRNWNLGSPSSDHASGRAYDLVGQNLGLYQMAVRASGGYAEFHGGSSGRHLHVVPGMNAPIGDTATPYMGMATVSSGGNSVTNVSMTVNAAPGMDVNALAAEVIYRLEQETRSNNERY
jgi:hypothetical protein